MPTKNLFTKKLKNYLPELAGKSLSLLNRPISFGLLAFIIFAILFGSLIYQRYLIIKQDQKKEAIVIANNAKDKMQEALTSGLSATKILSFFIDNSGTIKNFDSIAAQVFTTNKNIDVLELVPGGVIQYVYPLKGNESIVGYDILKDPARNKEAFKAIQKKELFFSGPFKLKQGGSGIVGRLPVFRDGKLWGFSAVVIKMTTLLKAAGIDRTGKDGYYYQLSKINPDTKKQEFFIPHVKEPLKDYLISVDIPEGEWKLSVEPVDNYKGQAEIFILALLGFLFSVLGGITVFIIVKRPEKLERLIRERTMALKNSENKYRSLIDRVSDAFVSLDNDWNFVYVNNKAGEIFSQQPEKLLGKNIWAEFPQAIDKPFYHAYSMAMETQEFQYLEDYYPLSDKWFENHIYPSKDGLTVFFKDVTEIQKVSLALKENEEKYRSLIEQASDGIVITDLDGYIIEVNDSIALMSGYSIDEMEGKHLHKFLPEDDIVLNPLRLKDLLGGKALLYERRLLKKDGSVLDIEVNSKMASTQTLIGFIRDISARKKNEEVLRYQASLLQSVSDAITSLDMDRRIVSWNMACEGLYGFTAEEAIGKRIPELVTFEYPDTNNEEVFKQVFNKGFWKGEFNFIHPKTKIKTNLLSSINLLKTKEGNTIGFIIHSKDITEIKMAEQTRVHEEQSRKLIMNSALDAIITINTEGAITLWNPQAEKIFGWSEEEIKGKQLSATIIPQQYRQRHEKGMQHYLQTGEGPVLNKMIEITALDRQGREFPVELSIIPLEQDGQQSFCAFIKDITERKKTEEELHQSEQKYRLLFYNNPLPMWMTTIPDLDIIDVNESAIRHYGYTRKEFLKLNAKDLRPPEDVEHFVNEVKKMKPGINNTRAWRHKKKDGTIIHVEIYSHEIFYQGQRVWLGLSQDVTEKYIAKELLQKSYEDIRLLASNLQSIREDERTNIAREIHDELGQQLTGLKMDMHWLSRKIKSADEEVNKKMKESIELIDATITTVRKIATDLRPSILDDLGLLAALEWQSEEFEKRSGTKVKFINKAGDLTVKPEVATALFRIYQELLTNIARHANAGLVTASLFIDENILYFSIKDDGTGFNTDTISSKKTLGLLGIKERTLLIGGTYEIKTRPGEGTETIISIPLNFVNVTV